MGVEGQFVSISCERSHLLELLVDVQHEGARVLQPSIVVSRHWPPLRQGRRPAQHLLVEQGGGTFLQRAQVRWGQGRDLLLAEVPPHAVTPSLLPRLLR